MFALPGKKDGFRLLLPDEIIPEEIEEKYTKILADAHSFITKPIDFLNETIQKVQVLGFSNGTVEQQQTDHPSLIRTPGDRWTPQGGSSATNYRAPSSPLALLDKTINIDFRHTLGYVNYFLMFESFWYMYSRDTDYIKNLDFTFNVDLLNERGAVYSRVVLQNPLLDGMDMLDFDFTQPFAQSGTFRCVFKYTNIDYQFINCDNITATQDITPFTETIVEAKKNAKENEKFLYYPYKEQEDIPLSKVEVIKSKDNSKTYVDENGNPIG